MPGAYSWRLERLARSQIRDASAGPVDQYNSTGEVYWCAVEELSASERLQAGVEVASILCRLRLRQFPELVIGDRLRDNETGFLYDVTGIVMGDNELICDAERSRPVNPGV